MKYAAYGSNLHPVRLQRRTGPVQFLGTAAVDGYALKFHKRGNIDGSGKCNIISERKSHVYVAVFDVSDPGIEKLDKAEGVGSGYEKDLIEVPNFGLCLTYLAQATHIDESLKPFTWYRELVLAGCRHHGFPGDYVHSISSQESVTDPDPDRNERHIQLLESLA